MLPPPVAIAFAVTDRDDRASNAKAIACGRAAWLLRTA